MHETTDKEDDGACQSIVDISHNSYQFIFLGKIVASLYVICNFKIS